MAIVDLRQLINKIQEKKQAPLNFALEFDCTIDADDITLLVKSMNYFINYTTKIAGENKVQVSLNAATDYHLLNFMTKTNASEYDEINPQVVDALKSYDAEIEESFEAGKFFSVNIKFNLS
jgi:hypothetical protein